MIFQETKIPGAYLIELELHEDERGFFARSFCQREFAKHGLHTEFVQCNLSYNRKKGTLRGMHYQVAPYEEVKLVTCVTGAIYDVILDIRKDSITYGKWIAVELTSRNRKILYIPKGIAHGFQTMEDESVVFYQMSEFYHSEMACNVRWNDKKFSISWIDSNPILSEKDR